MRRRDTMSLLCFFLLSFSSALASSVSLHRQTDALDELYFNPTKLQRMVGFEDPTSMVVSSTSIEKRIYRQQGLKEADKISELPGQPKGVDFDQYGGYVTVDELAGRALFYYFAEAAGGGSASKPLLFWFNGGPGCSSLGFGAMEELGPFRVMSDGKTLFRNPYAWNKVANVLFLESPAGVGFSYSNTTSDYHKSGDRKTADDALIFILNWLERFPEYKDRDLFLAGESYAGHYVPQLAHTILQHNHHQSTPTSTSAKRTTKRTTIHLKGFMIGNAVINDATDTKGMYDYFWTHALISDESIVGIHKYCNFSNDAVQSHARDCDRVMEDAIANVGEIDIYNIYAPLCTSNVTQTPKIYSIENFDPCSSNYVNTYLNSFEVQKALHANVTKLNYTWSACSRVPSPWQDGPSSVLPLIKESMHNGIRVWVYSGDIDGRVPVTSTRYSLNELKLREKSKWHPWYIKKEVAGYGVTYEGNLTFSTIRGAGHEVPSYQPERALILVKSFIEGKLPSI